MSRRGSSASDTSFNSNATTLGDDAEQLSAEESWSLIYDPSCGVLRPGNSRTLKARMTDIFNWNRSLRSSLGGVVLPDMKESDLKEHISAFIGQDLSDVAFRSETMQRDGSKGGNMSPADFSPPFPDAIWVADFTNETRQGSKRTHGDYIETDEEPLPTGRPNPIANARCSLSLPVNITEKTLTTFHEELSTMLERRMANQADMNPAADSTSQKRT